MVSLHADVINRSVSLDNHSPRLPVCENNNETGFENEVKQHYHILCVQFHSWVHCGLSITVYDHENKQSYERKQDPVFTILVVNTDIPILGFDTYNLKFDMNWQ